MSTTDNGSTSQTENDSAHDNTNSDQPQLTGSLLFWACFWFLPLGVYAVHLASKVDERAARGDSNGAAEASATALRWANIAIRLGIGLTAFFVLVMCNASDTSTTTTY